MTVTTTNKYINRILVVDDEPYNLEIIADYLDQTGYELLTATDGRQAWKILEQSADDIDLVLLDRMLPGLCGMQILAKMKDHLVLQHTPVIFQTAKIDRQDIIEGMQAGAFYYLSKPFAEEMLRSVVKTALEEHQHYKMLQNELEKRTRTLNLMQHGQFRFRTLEEAHDLALFISNTCPVPGRVLTGLTELMINAVEHGNLGISYAEKTDLIANNRWRNEVEHRLTLRENLYKFATLIYQLGDNQIRITIKDKGDGFDWQNYLEVALDRIADNHGRGIAMAKILSFDDIVFKGNGNEVIATINTRKKANITVESMCELGSV